MDEKIRIALVGRFQMGKSSCINGLLRQQKATVGDGFDSETAECSEYPFADGVVLVDTPGFDDPAGRDQLTEMAIRRADCVLFVVDNQRCPDDVYRDWRQKLKDWRKPTVLLCNCFDGGVEEPLSSAGLVAFAKGIEFLMPVRGELVLPINASWDAPRNLDVLRDYLGNIRLALLSHLARSLRDRNCLFDNLSKKFRREFSNRIPPCLRASV